MKSGCVTCGDLSGTIDIEKGRVLDNLYVPTRYANGHSEGAPFEHFGSLQSEEAIRYAGEIIEFVRTRLA